jgi:hypothetical protein
VLVLLLVLAIKLLFVLYRSICSIDRRCAGCMRWRASTCERA